MNSIYLLLIQVFLQLLFHKFDIYHLRQALLENNKNAEALYGMGIAYAKEEKIDMGQRMGKCLENKGERA